MFEARGERAKKTLSIQSLIYRSAGTFLHQYIFCFVAVAAAVNFTLRGGDWALTSPIGTMAWATLLLAINYAYATIWPKESVTGGIPECLVMGFTGRHGEGWIGIVTTIAYILFQFAGAILGVFTAKEMTSAITGASFDVEVNTFTAEYGNFHVTLPILIGYGFVLFGLMYRTSQVSTYSNVHANVDSKKMPPSLSAHNAVLSTHAGTGHGGVAVYQWAVSLFMGSFEQHGFAFWNVLIALSIFGEGAINKLTRYGGVFLSLLVALALWFIFWYFFGPASNRNRRKNLAVERRSRGPVRAGLAEKFY